MVTMSVKFAKIIHFQLLSQLHLSKSAKTALTKQKVVQATLLNYTLAIGWNQKLPQSFIAIMRQRIASRISPSMNKIIKTIFEQK